MTGDAGNTAALQALQSAAAQTDTPSCNHATDDGDCPVCGPDGPPHPDAPPRQYWPCS